MAKKTRFAIGTAAVILALSGCHGETPLKSVEQERASALEAAMESARNGKAGSAGTVLQQRNRDLQQLQGLISTLKAGTNRKTEEPLDAQHK